MESGTATMPFVLGSTVVVVKNVPAEICRSCHEAFMIGVVTDTVTDMLSQSVNLQAEILVLTYPAVQEYVPLAA
jgi:YgiT-type zinc finger domain-containing protein